MTAEIPRPTAASDTKSPSLHRTASISETIELSQSGRLSGAPSWLRWIEIPFHIPDSETGQKLPEVAGWAMDSAGRGPLNLVGSYVGAAVLRMAIREAGGPNNIVRGLLKPSSLLTAASSLIGVIAALLMPVFGAIVDHTVHRRLVGVVSGIAAVGLVGVQISISVEKNNWFFILIIDMLQSFSLLVHTTAIFAYLPDLSTVENVISHYTARISVRQYLGGFLAISLIIIANTARDIQQPLLQTVQTARDSAGICFGWSLLCIGYAWSFLMRDRPALSKVPEGSTLLSTGFVQVFRTSRKIARDYQALRWFMLSLLWSPEAGAGVVLSIAVTFVTVVVKFTGDDLAKGLLIYMIANVPGSYFSILMCRIINPLNSYRAGLFVLGISLGASYWLFTGPEDKGAVWGLTGVWGFCNGWVYPSQRVLFCQLIPKGQETEMMGLFTFSGQILGWLPPLIVTIMNEKGVDLRWSLAIVCFFCFFAVIVTLPMGNYEEACAIVERDSVAKIQAIKDNITPTVERAIEEGGNDSKVSDPVPNTVDGSAFLSAVEGGEASEAASEVLG